MNKLITATLAIVCLFLSNTIQAQTTGSVFALTGDYIKIGVSDYGTIGSKGNTSPGMLYDNTGTRTFNTSYDYLTPGTPFEGFTVKYTNGSGTTVTQANNNTGSIAITGGILTNYSGVAYGGTTFDNRAIWTGNGTGYSLINDVRFNNNQKFIDITTTLTSTVTMTNLYFGRYIDPDARAATGDSSATTNTLGYSPIGVKQVVFSEALASKYALGLYTAASNAGAGISSSWTTDPINYYNGVNSGTGDYTIGLGFLVPSVAVGDIVTFQYAYIFGPSTLTAGATAVSSGAGGGTAGVVPGCTSSCDMVGVTPPTSSAPTVTSTSNATITVSDTTTVNTSLPVVTASLAHHTASESAAKQTIARETTTNVTTPYNHTVTTLVRTTTNWSDSTTSVADSATSSTTTLVNNVATTVVDDSFSGRIDQQAQLTKLNMGINQGLNMSPFRTDGYQSTKGYTLYVNGGSLRTSMGDGYSAKSDVSSIAGDKQFKDNWKVGLQYSSVNTTMPGVDSNTKQDKEHMGVYSVFTLPNDAIISTNLGNAKNNITTSRTVENLFNNSYTTKGTDTWLSNKVYTPEYFNMVRVIAGYTTGTSKTNGYTEDGSIQSARTVDAINTSFSYGEFGVRLRKDINKFAVSGEVIAATNGYKTIDASIVYKLDKGQTISLNAVRQERDQIATNSVSVRAKINF
tara:strand:+ start:7612 stop:9666 length:2055 start_codon:yes stop_codon:yes gene_type:complete